MDNTVGSLTQLQKSVIIGSILGDGYLRMLPKRNNAFLEINHSIKQKDYVDWKYNILSNLVISPPKTRQGKGARIAYRFYTRQHHEITELLGMFYRKKKKIMPPHLIIDPIILAVWYMDDGSKCRSSDVYLNTQQFSIKYQNNIVKILNNFGLEARLNKDKDYYRVRFLKSSLPKLKNIISEYIVPSMKYKIEL